MFNKSFLLLLYAATLCSCSALGFDQSPPEITVCSPSDGQDNVPSGSTVSVTFNEKMDQESVERAFSLSMENKGEVKGSFSWNGNTLLFTPTFPLEVSPKYIIRLSQKAEDSGGNNLLTDHISTFTIQGRGEIPQLLAHWPEDGTNILSRTNDILITFSTNMDLLSLREGFSVSPSVSGILTLISNGNVFCFHPTTPLVHSTTYTVKLSKGISDTAGNTLAEERSFKFTVGTDFVAPTLVSFTTQGGIDLRTGDPMITNISKFSPLLISFSEDMDSTETRSAFSIEPSVDGDLRVTGSNLLFTPTESFSPETVYTVIIGDSATDLQGNTMHAGERIIFKTDAADSRYLFVQGIYNETNYIWSQNVVVPIMGGTLTNLKIQFSAPITHLGVIPHFSIEYFTGSQTDSQGEIGRIEIVSNNRVLLFDLKEIGEGNIYKLSVTKNAYDTDDNTMQEDWIFFFQT